MVLEKESSSKSGTGTIVAHNVGVAIDKDKGSQHALKWAIENLICRGQTISLIHIKKRPSVPTPGGISHLSFPDILGDGAAKGLKTINADQQISELFLTFRAFCSRKEIKCNEIVLEDADIARSLCDYARIHFIDVLVLGAPTRVSFVRFKGPDVPTTVTKVAPDFCSVYIVSKGKTLSIRQATGPVPTLSSQASTNNHDNNNSVVNPPTIHHHDSRITHHDHHDSRAIHHDHHDSRAIHHDHHDSRTTHHHHHHHDSRTTHHNHHDHHDSRTTHHDHHGSRTPHHDHHGSRTPHHDHHGSRTPHHNHHDHHDSRTPHHDHHDSRTPRHNHFGSDPTSYTPKTHTEDVIKSPFARNNKNFNNTSHYEHDIGGSDISFVSSDRSNSENDFYHSSKFNIHEETPTSRHISHDYEYKHGFTSPFAHTHREKSPDNSFTSENSSTSSTHSACEMEAEMKRLKKELQQTIDMYSTACKEALSAKQRATELHQWKVQEHHKLLEAKKAEGAALAMAQREKEKTKAAIDAAEASKKVAEHEVQKRIMAEMMVMKESDHKGPSMSHGDTRYRKYSIEEIEAATDKFDNSRKIGEGGYGPVFKCSLDHTLVAVKVLRPDAAQGRSQFNQEVEVLCCIRHPNMVLLLGACPEYGCLVYEHMANGSLEDRLFCRGNSPVLSWQLRFRIASEIATGLLFLHQTKPEPLVHRDLKPGNILLDRNFVSKISDVGLARLVPPTVANSVTQYRMTATAGTFCYIDPEYQQTGMLGIKSDIYSLGIMLLQIVTAKSPMGLAHQVERAIEQGNFAEMLDPAVQDWPVEEATSFAKMALKCAELRRKDRPDLKMVILPELNRLRNFSEDFPTHSGNTFHGSGHSHSSMTSISLSSVPSQDSVGSDANRSHGNRH